MTGHAKVIGIAKSCETNEKKLGLMTPNDLG